MDEQSETRILIIEDNHDDGYLLLRQLQKAGIQKHVKVIPDGGQALDYLRERSRYEQLIAVFLDLNLPTVSGITILENIRSNVHLQRFPVVVMTSSNSPQDLHRCRQLGVSSYVEKPVTFEAFSKAIADTFHSVRVPQNDDA